MCLTMEYAGQHILVLAPPTNAAILPGFRGVVKVALAPPWTMNSKDDSKLHSCLAQQGKEREIERDGASARYSEAGPELPTVPQENG